MTRFSIIIPCFNAAETISETLDSIRAQSFSDWEVICIDDGSRDATTDILDHAAKLDPRIRFIFNDGKGPSRARNLGALGLAQGEIIAFCDADDIWAPEKLSQLSDCFTNPSVDAAFGQIAFFQNSPSDAMVFSTVPSTPLTIPMLLGENPVCTMSNIAVRRETLMQTGGFNETMVHNEDLDWLIRLVGDGANVVGLQVCQTWYRANPFGLSADLPSMATGRRAAIDTAARYGFSPSKQAHAIHYRYLARRALRLGHGRFDAIRYAAMGMLNSPKGFFNAPKRGVLTLFGAIVNVVLPASVARTLFAR